MDKIAIISDIHGNLEALKTALLDIKRRNIKTIYCLGDIVGKGTHQKECVDLVRKECMMVLRGNNDDFFSRTWDKSELTDLEQKRYNWIRSKLTKQDLCYLQTLPFCYEFYLSGRLVRLFHAHPEKNYNFIGNIDTLERTYEFFLPSKNTIPQEKGDLIVYGHIRQFSLRC